MENITLNSQSVIFCIVLLHESKKILAIIFFTFSTKKMSWQYVSLLACQDPWCDVNGEGRHVIDTPNLVMWQTVNNFLNLNGTRWLPVVVGSDQVKYMYS